MKTLAPPETLGAALREQLQAPHDPLGSNVEGFDPRATPLVRSRSVAEKGWRQELRPALALAHDRLMAHAEHPVLLILQGLDASGKSGTIKHVVSALNPVGVRITSFKEPTGREEREPWLARIERALPGPGEVAVFDRSHYEDAIVPAVLEPQSDSLVDQRIKAILTFEQRLAATGTVLVKCLLNVSYDEQRERFRRRLRRADKRWKFSAGDLETRRLWSQYMAAYGHVIGRTSTDVAPWHVIPADHKWYRNWAVAQILVDVLTGLHDDYPSPDLDVAALQVQLEPPN